MYIHVSSCLTLEIYLLHIQQSNHDGALVHANAKQLMRKGKYKDSLEVLNMGEI